MIGLGMCFASPERTSNVDVGVAEMKIMRSSRLEESARECGRTHQSERFARGTGGSVLSPTTTNVR